MLEKVDVRFVGIIGILIVLAIGYLVYVMYQDLTSIKKELLEIQHNYVELKDEEEYQHQDEDDDQDYLDYEQEIENSLESFIENPPIGFVFDGNDQEELEEPVVLEEQLPEVKEKKPRKYKKKEKNLEIISENNEENLCEH